MRVDLVPKSPGADWRSLPNIKKKLLDGRTCEKMKYKRMAGGRRSVCSCFSEKGQGCSTPQGHRIIPWSCAHTADRHHNRVGEYGRVPWDGFFKTILTDLQLGGTQGQVIHPDQNRLLSVRECARGQGFRSVSGIRKIRNKSKENE